MENDGRSYSVGADISKALDELMSAENLITKDPVEGGYIYKLRF